MERIHGIDHTEPGAIAGACVLAIWGRSSDKCLYPSGDHANIDYKARFDGYLDLLTSGPREMALSIIRMFSEWDHILFPNAGASHASPQRKQRRGKSDGYQRARGAMKAEIQAQDENEEHGEDESQKPGSQDGQADSQGSGGGAGDLDMESS
ncbi:hypothetical protein DFH09DRAFT_1313194 [Mycena vulgaris]|nr:hypothetical protein DFH09DRAFT_1313194 [Mycena vulgaris]